MSDHQILVGTLYMVTLLVGMKLGEFAHTIISYLLERRENNGTN